MSAVQEQAYADAPVGTRANLAPTSIEVASNLAEDTVIAGAMDIATGDNKVAMFANPFAGGSEEMLYVDELGTMRWARHVTSPIADQQLGEQPSGWSIEPLVNNVVEVVVAVHPTGAVFAWVLQGDASSRNLSSYELVADPAVLGGHRWAQGKVWLPDMNLSGLSVQYCDDRPATPVVFVTDPAEPRLFWYLPNFSPDAEGLSWHPGGEFAYDPADRGLAVVAGVDDPSESSPLSVVRAVRVWSAASDGLWMTTYLPWYPDQPYSRQRVIQGEGVQLVGRWTHPYGAGVVARPRTAQRIMMVAPSPGGSDVQTVVLDQPLDDVKAWQDSTNLMHLYGRDHQGALNAVHQTGWVEDAAAPFRYAMPAWDHHTDPHGQQVLTTRPLVAKLATYAIDAFPDEQPSQHVMHQGVAPGEACAIYTQSTRTNFWSTEKVRLVPETLPAPYTVPRYQTSLTVKDAFGSPRGGVAVSLSADVPVDLEIDGRFYRTGAVTPLVLTTDFSGRITMRVVANGLTVPALYATVPGMAASVTVQMAADVHKFLAGDGSLPNHPDGFTADTVTSATKPDGKPLFPHLRKNHETGTWPPSAEDVVTWCSGAFAVDTGVPLPAGMLAGLAEGEAVVGFTLQTHDRERPGFEVFTTRDQVAARRTAIEAKGGFFDDADDWWGDVWQGIRTGVNAVTEVFVDVANRAIEIAITLADGVMSVLRAAWDDIVSAAHAVEAAFVAIGAAIDDALQWLRWAFDLADVFATAKAMQSGISGLAKLVDPVIDHYEGKAHGWFVSQETEVKKLFADLKESVLPGRTVGSTQTPFAGTPGDVAVPATSGATAQQGGPHANWLTDKLTSPQNRAPGGQAPAVRTPVTEAVDTLAEEFLDIVTSAKAWPQLEAAWGTSASCGPTSPTPRTPRRRSPRSSPRCSTCSSTWSRRAWSSSTTSCSRCWNGCGVPCSRCRTSSAARCRSRRPCSTWPGTSWSRLPGSIRTRTR